MGTLLERSYTELASDEKLNYLRNIQTLQKEAAEIVKEYYNTSIKYQQEMLLKKAQSYDLYDPSINDIVNSAILEYYNSRVYADALPDFNEILEIYKKVSTELGITAPLDLAHLYTYMIDKGYYSPAPHRRDFRSFFQLPKPILTHPQYNVIRGIRDPRGEAAMLTEQMKFCGEECANIMIETEERPKGAIETINGRRKFDLKFLLPWIGGVVLNCGNNKSGIVMSNGFVLAPNSSEEAKLINPNSAGTFFLEMPYSLLVYSDNVNELQIFENLLFQPREALTTNDVRKSQEYITDVIANSIDTLEKARQEAIDPIERAYAKVKRKTVLDYIYVD